MNICLIIIGVLFISAGVFRMANATSKEKAIIVHTPSASRQGVETWYEEDDEEEVSDHEVVYPQFGANQSKPQNQLPASGQVASSQSASGSSQSVTSAAEQSQSASDRAASAQSKPAVQTADLNSKQKGNHFEDFVANLFKNRKVYSVLEWNQGQTSSEGVYAENDKNPDFKIQQTLSDGFKLVYWVECKYRASFNAYNCVVINNYQLKRYREIQRSSHRKVLIAIGIGMKPNAPTSFYLIPLDSISGENISREELQPFYMSSPSSQFAPRVADWFQNHVFKKRK